MSNKKLTDTDKQSENLHNQHWLHYTPDKNTLKEVCNNNGID